MSEVLFANRHCRLGFEALDAFWPCQWPQSINNVGGNTVGTETINGASSIGKVIAAPIIRKTAPPKAPHVVNYTPEAVPRNRCPRQKAQFTYTIGGLD